MKEIKRKIKRKNSEQDEDMVGTGRRPERESGKTRQRQDEKSEETEITRKKDHKKGR